MAFGEAVSELVSEVIPERREENRMKEREKEGKRERGKEEFLSFPLFFICGVSLRFGLWRHRTREEGGGGDDS